MQAAPRYCQRTSGSAREIGGWRSQDRPHTVARTVPFGTRLLPHCMETPMKLMTIAILLMLTGCATQPMTSQERAYRLQMLQIATQQPHYVLPAPQPIYVPQTHTANCYTVGNSTNCTVQ